MNKILLVDDEKEILQDKTRIIRELGYECHTAKCGKDAIDIIKRVNPDVVITDMKIPNQNGFDILKAASKIEPMIPVVIFTGYGTVELAVEAMKMGAYDYIQKPFLPELMEAVIRRAVEFRNIQKENISLKDQLAKTYELTDVIGQTDAIRQVIQRVLKVAKSDANVLIFGESGTGKELIARNIHRFSPRCEKPFIPLDCVALPSTLLESELFGFEKGAFTGAIKSKPGVFELAEEGTLFFDEITELDLHLQAKLLRVLQERHFRRIGGKELTSVNVRIISATNWNPKKAVEENHLREDLYFRLNVVPIYVPTLRERKQDIPLLVRHFIEKYNPFCSIEIQGVSGEAMQCLKSYSWPGNVRELENVVQRAMSLTDHGTIQLDDLPEELMAHRENVIDESLLNLNYKEAKGKCLEQFTKHYLSRLLKTYDGNITRVARVAGISRNSLYRLLKCYHIDY